MVFQHNTAWRAIAGADLNMNWNRCRGLLVAQLVAGHAGACCQWSSPCRRWGPVASVPTTAPHRRLHSTQPRTALQGGRPQQPVHRLQLWGGHPGLGVERVRHARRARGCGCGPQRCSASPGPAAQACARACLIGRRVLAGCRWTPSMQCLLASLRPSRPLSCSRQQHVLGPVCHRAVPQPAVRPSRQDGRLRVWAAAQPGGRLNQEGMRCAAAVAGGGLQAQGSRVHATAHAATHLVPALRRWAAGTAPPW